MERQNFRLQVWARPIRIWPLDPYCDEMRKLGRPPTLHHAELIAGESRELLAPDIGVYRFDDLVVLRQTQMPAVLLEAGVIADPADEAYVSDPANQARFVGAIVNAVRRYASNAGSP